MYNHAKLMSQDPRASGKEFLVATMYRMYDLNGNDYLEGYELDQVFTLKSNRLPSSVNVLYNWLAVG